MQDIQRPFAHQRHVVNSLLDPGAYPGREDDGSMMAEMTCVHLGAHVHSARTSVLSVVLMRRSDTATLRVPSNSTGVWHLTTLNKDWSATASQCDASFQQSQKTFRPTYISAFDLCLSY